MLVMLVTYQHSMHISVLDKDVVDVFLRIFSSAFLLYVPLGFNTRVQ